MSMSRFMCALVSLVANFSVAQAIQVSVHPTADSTVDAINPDTAGSSGELLAAAEGAFGEPASTLSYVYTQFTLPDGLTGRDIGAINSVDLLFSRANPNTALNLTYYAYGVFDGVDAGTADDYVWNDGIGFFPENTEIRNFADTNELSYYSDPAESSFIGTIQSSSAGDPTAPFGLASAQTQTARDNFRALLMNDTDGKITIYTKVRQNFGVTALQPFESIEDVNQFTEPPTLVFDYEATGAGDFDRDNDVDGNDFLAWQRGESPNMGSSADLLIWAQNYGGPAPALAAASAVPEPATLAATVLGMLFAASRRRRQPRG